MTNRSAMLGIHSRLMIPDVISYVPTSNAFEGLSEEDFGHLSEKTAPVARTKDDDRGEVLTKRVVKCGALAGWQDGPMT